MKNNVETDGTGTESGDRNTSDSTIRSDTASKCWLQEHDQMRRGIELNIVSMRHMVAFQVTTLGVIAGLVIANPTERVLLLLVIPISSFIIGSFAYFYIRGVFETATYIRDRIAPELRRIAGDEAVLGYEAFVEERRREVTRVERWVTMPGIMLAIFGVPSIVALIITGYHVIKGQDTAVALWIAWGLGVLLSFALGLGFIRELKRLIWGESTKESRKGSSSSR